MPVLLTLGTLPASALWANADLDASCAYQFTDPFTGLRKYDLDAWADAASGGGGIAVVASYFHATAQAGPNPDDDAGGWPLQTGAHANATYHPTMLANEGESVSASARASASAVGHRPEQSGPRGASAYCTGGGSYTSGPRVHVDCMDDGDLTFAGATRTFFDSSTSEYAIQLENGLVSYSTSSTQTVVLSNKLSDYSTVTPSGTMVAIGTVLLSTAMCSYADEAIPQFY
jgi:hypothetical protein